jgi:hypothetical protein
MNQSKKNSKIQWARWRAAGAVRENYGRAYGLFECQASKELLQKEFLDTRRMVESPIEFELSLTDINSDHLPEVDRQFSEIVSMAKEEGINYLLEATLPKESNRRTAEELAANFNLAYVSPLFPENEMFKGAILYKDHGKYCSLA